MKLVQLDRTGFDLVFADDFTGDRLDPDRWIPHYLPHWTTPARSAARYRLGDDGLHLLIEADQPAWLPEDGEMRASNLQTGSFSGPLNSGVGQHRHRAGLQVRTPQPTRRLWTPSAGLVEATMRASSDPTCLTALWLVGLEESSAHDSGEVCVVELFGNVVGARRSQVRTGVKAHHDPRLRTEMQDKVLNLDATQPHSYAAVWDAHRVEFYVDDVMVHTVEQGITYPLQLMVDLFEFPASAERRPAAYPKSAQLISVRGYQKRHRPTGR